jgi:Icc-related predicted phosphoesterase
MPDRTSCLFASDLHGRADRYEKLLSRVAAERPRALFLGGDLLPSGLSALEEPAADFVGGFLVPAFRRLREELRGDAPRVLLILGNDDPRACEGQVRAAAAAGTWEYVHGQRVALGDFDVYGYACVPPTPFLLKDWERYDVSRYVEPGCLSPEEGWRTVPVPENEVRYGTIEQDLQRLAAGQSLERAVFLFHTPPYRTNLDRAALDNLRVDHAPLDVHVGSVAVRRLIERGRPLLTLHGHIHESARLTGAWHDRIGRTHCLSAAHDGPELALVRFAPEDPGAAQRELL